MPTFNPHQRGEFVFAVSTLDVIHRERHHHAVRMTRSLFIDGIDQIERVLGKVSSIRFRIYPDRKKFRSQISAPRFVEAYMADILWIRRANIESFVEKSLRRVGMGVDDDGGSVERARAFAHGVR